MNIQPLSEDQRDCLQELSNIAMGQAADSLARFLEVFVNLSVPKIQLVATSEVAKVLDDEDAKEAMTAISQSFYDAQGQNSFHGEAIVLFAKSSAETLSQLIADPSSSVDEGLLDISNILTAACLNGLAEQLDSRLSFSAPNILGHELSSTQIFNSGKLNWDTALMITIKYTFEKNELSCNLILIMPDESVRGILAKVDKILDEF